MNGFEKIYKILNFLDKKFPDGRDPFQRIARLTEEVGELASQVNHFEDSGIKRQKHGEPNKEELAKEIQDVLRTTLYLAQYYHVEQELQDSIDKSLEKLESEAL
jgi:NTP pyrophosphatase (non-canonical NTP hydrolase)